MNRKQMDEVRAEIKHWDDLMESPDWDENTTAMWAMAEEIVRLRKALEQCIAERDTWRNLYDKERGAYYSGDDRYLHEPAGEVPKGKTRRL
jgi:hypothetical protein